MTRVDEPECERIVEIVDEGSPGASDAELVAAAVAAGLETYGDLDAGFSSRGWSSQRVYVAVQRAKDGGLVFEPTPGRFASTEDVSRGVLAFVAAVALVGIVFAVVGGWPL